MIAEIYFLGCLVAFCLGWMQADEERRNGRDNDVVMDLCDLLVLLV